MSSRENRPARVNFPPIPYPTVIDEGLLQAVQMLIERMEDITGRVLQWISGAQIAHHTIEGDNIVINSITMESLQLYDGDTHLVADDPNLIHIDPDTGIITHRAWDYATDGYKPPCLHIGVVDGDTHAHGDDANVLHRDPETGVITHRTYDSGTDGNLPPCDTPPKWQ